MNITGQKQADKLWAVKVKKNVYRTLFNNWKSHFLRAIATSCDNKTYLKIVTYFAAGFDCLVRYCVLFV